METEPVIEEPTIQLIIDEVEPVIVEEPKTPIIHPKIEIKEKVQVEPEVNTKKMLGVDKTIVIHL